VKPIPYLSNSPFAASANSSDVIFGRAIFTDLNSVMSGDESTENGLRANCDIA
jgi:hypothetical protein